MGHYARPLTKSRALPWLLGLFSLSLDLHFAGAWAGQRFAQNVLHRVGRRHRTCFQVPIETPKATVHEHFMGLALEQAQEAARRGEVPIGALVVVSRLKDPVTAIHNNQNSTAPLNYYEILSAQHNRVEMLHDASAHAELLALRAAARKVRNWRLPVESTLYSTLEPCAICLSAAQAFRVAAIVYGAPDLRLGAVSTHLQLLDDTAPQHPFHTISSVTSGIRQDECGALLQSFFRERRQQKKTQRPAKTISKCRRWFFFRRCTRRHSG